MIERQIDSPIPMPLGLVVKKALKRRLDVLRLDADAGVLNLDQHLLVLVPARSDHQLAGTVGDGRHGLHPVHHQIDDHLLQLDPITEHRGQRGRRAPAAARCR